MIATVDEYINQYEGQPREWLVTMVTYMREQFPDIPETISYQMPMYKFGGKYVAFSVAKEHFSFHTLDFDMIEELKSLIPTAYYGKGCIKIKYADKQHIPLLMDCCNRLVKKHRS